MANYLKPDSIRTVSVGGDTLTINIKITPDGARKADGSKFKPEAKLGGDGKPRGITIHNTGAISVSAQTNMAEQYARACYPNGNLNTVAVHFWVWHDVIWQQLDESERGWHATDGSTRRASQRPGQKIGGNLDTISIECIGPDAESEATTAKLVAYLCQAHGLDPAYDVYQHHYFYAKKDCPEYIAPHWDKFLATVRGYMTKEDEEVKRYQRLKDVPEEYKFQETIKLLMDAGIIGGDGSDKTGNNDIIDLSEEQVRTFVILYRGGAFDRKLQAVGMETAVK